MTLIGLELLTDDQELQTLCELYWEVDKDGKFVYKVSEVADLFHLETRTVASVVRKNCYAFRADLQCENCGKPTKYLKNRSDMSLGWRGGEHYRICDACRDEQKKLYAERAQQQVEALKRQKSEKMKTAFENGVYESLNLLEFNFLIALSQSENTAVARKKVGISEKNATSIIEKLNNLHLINWNIGIQGYSIFPDLYQALRRINLDRRVKSVFGSPKAHELYRKLKQAHLFVFPEIPICSFIEREQVEHLFSEKWHSIYFLTARLDFVVCDPDGKPKFGVEYQGGYHNSADQRQKDEFKRVILNEVGLPLRELTNKELNEFEAFWGSGVDDLDNEIEEQILYDQQKELHLPIPDELKDIIKR